MEADVYYLHENLRTLLMEHCCIIFNLSRYCHAEAACDTCLCHGSEWGTQTKATRRERAGGMSEYRVSVTVLAFGIQQSLAICRQISRPFHKAFRVLAVSARRRVAGATSCVRYDFLLC